MSTVNHPRSVQAARVIEEDKKVLAEMLFVEIPPRGKGRTPAGVQTIEDELRETAAEILEGTGKRYDWGTLNDFRKVAAWVAGANWGVNTPISWADASWTAHLEAYKKGLKWADFAAGKRTKRAVREQTGASTGDVPAAGRAISQQPQEAAKLVENMTPEGRRAVQDALDNASVQQVGAKAFFEALPAETRDAIGREFGQHEAGMDAVMEGFKNRPQAKAEQREYKERVAAETEGTRTVYHFRIKSIFAPVLVIKAYLTELTTPGDGRDFEVDDKGAEHARMMADFLTSMANGLRAWANGDTRDLWDRGLDELLGAQNGEES